MIIGIIMGRKGSKGFPGKNLFKVAGKPLAWYPMNAARTCRHIDKTYLSTDDEKLMVLAKKNGINILIRPPELCADSVLGEDVYLHAYEIIKKEAAPKKIELIVLLMCNAPLVTPELITEGIDILRKFPEYDSAVSVSKYNMWSPLRARKIGPDGLLHPFVPFSAFCDPEKLNCDRNSQGDIWFADMSVSVIRPACLEHMEKGLLPQKWMGQRIYPLKRTGGLDVDYQWQIPQVEYWLHNNQKGKV